MTTAQNLITRACRQANLIEAGETPSAAVASDALDTLNEMLHGWAKKGVDLQHVTMALGDAFLLDDSYLEGIKDNLTLRLAEQYGRVLDPRVSMRAEDAFKAFQAHTLEFDDDLTADKALDPRYFANRRIGGYNIDKG